MSLEANLDRWNAQLSMARSAFKPSSLANNNSNDDGGGGVLLFVVSGIFICLFAIIVFLIRSGKLKELVAKIKHTDQGTAAAGAGAAAGGSPGAPQPSPGAPRPSPGAPQPSPGAPRPSPPRSPLAVQASVTGSPPQSTMDSVLTSLGANAGWIGVSAGVDVAVELIVHSDDIAKWIARRALNNPATKRVLEKGASKAIKRTFVGSLKKVFRKLGAKAAAQLGARWAKSAVQAGKTAASISESAARQAGERSAEMAARIAAERAAATAARLSASAVLGPVGALYDAVTMAGIALDSANVGNYAELQQTSDLLQMKKDIDRGVVNVNIACSSIPQTADCPTDPDAPPDEPDPDTTTKAGRYPLFFGPLDKEQSDDPTAFNAKLNDKVVELMTTKPYTARVQAIYDEMNAAHGEVFVRAFRNQGLNPADFEIPEISDEEYAATFLSHWTDADSDYFYDKALDALCTNAGGVLFTPGDGYDRTCTYRTMEDCHAQYPWPPPDDDSLDLTYTEWRAKSWFDQFKTTTGANSLTMANIPDGGACITADAGMHQLCDKDITTGSGAVRRTARNAYRRDTGECYNTEQLCDIKGVQYTDAMNPASMANLTDHTLPSCYTNTADRVCENVVGVTTCRFFQSGGLELGFQAGYNAYQQGREEGVEGANMLVNLNLSSTGNPVIDALGVQAEGGAAAVGATFITLNTSLDSFTGAFGQGQQSLSDIQGGLDATAAAAAQGLNATIDDANRGSVVAALSVPLVAVAAGASLGVAAIGAAFSALDTLVHSGGEAPPNCPPGFSYQTSGSDWRGYQTYSCYCPGKETNGVCCPLHQTSFNVNGQWVCRADQYPSWWDGNSVCTPYEAPTCTYEPGGYQQVADWSAPEVCQPDWEDDEGNIQRGACAQPSRLEWVPETTLCYGGQEERTSSADPRDFGSRNDYCNTASTASEREQADRDEAARQQREADERNAQP